MRYIFLLSGDYIDLAKEEIISLFDIKKYRMLNRLLIVELKNDIKSLKILSKRLALTKNIYKFLFECKINDLIRAMKNYDWNSIYKDNFCLRIHNFNNNKKFIKKITIKNNTIKKISNKTRTTHRKSKIFECDRKSLCDLSTFKSKHDKSEPFQRHKSVDTLIKWDIKSHEFPEKDLAKYIWHSVKNPKVDLNNPSTKIELFFIENKVYCRLLIYENNEDFESRKSHLRPFPHPSSLHPKLARALVNISGIKDNKTLLDPFCGTGGFLIEAGLMNIKTIGYDINKLMIKGCIKNLKHYKINNYKIKNQNALNINNKFDYVVTDLPYGLNSNAMALYEEQSWKKHRINKKIQKKDFYKKLEQFYLKFLKNLRKKLKKKAVIIFPSYVNHKKLLKQSDFKMEKEFSIYVHRSLTRKIVRVS